MSLHQTAIMFFNVLQIHPIAINLSFSSNPSLRGSLNNSSNNSIFAFNPIAILANMAAIGSNTFEWIDHCRFIEHS